MEAQRLKLSTILANAYRRLTDYTLVQELVQDLSETLAEEKVVERVFDTFAALLAPQRMTFVSVEDGRVERVWQRPEAPGPESRTEPRELAEFKRAYAWIEDGRGFRLSIRHRSKTLGVVEVRGIAPVEQKEHYLDLALVITRVAGLALSNAQLYQEMKGPERTSLEFAEDLRDALLARKRAEEKQAQLLRQVEAANQELADFAHVVSHDLKAPLRAIDSLARWLVADYRDRFDDAGRDQMNLLIGRVDRMRALIDGILQYSRAGRLRSEPVAVSLAEVVPVVVESLAPPAHIRVRVEGALPVVTGEKVKLEQLFQNLLSNAIKYSDKPEGDVRVGCAEAETGPDGRAGQGFHKCHVADNGPGIEEKDFVRVFQLFQTLRPRDEADSTGVGLSVVKKIVETGGGQVWLESKVGAGTTFYFTLPKRPEAARSEDG
jgi:signal transduction histidine kinase